VPKRSKLEDLNDVGKQILEDILTGTKSLVDGYQEFVKGGHDVPSMKAVEHYVARRKPDYTPATPKIKVAPEKKTEVRVKLPPAPIAVKQPAPPVPDDIKYAFLITSDGRIFTNDAAKAIEISREIQAIRKK